MVVPANAQIFFGYILTVISFDPVDIEEPVGEYFDLKQSDGVELAINFVELGYESSYFLINLGSLLAIYLV